MGRSIIMYKYKTENWHSNSEVSYDKWLNSFGEKGWRVIDIARSKIYSTKTSDYDVKIKVTFEKETE